MLDQFICGRIYEAAETSSTVCVAQRFAVSRKTVARVKRLGARAAERKSRVVSQKIVKRRRVLASLAKVVAKKGHRKFPKFGCARQLRAGLRGKTGELLSVRQVQRDMLASGHKPYIRQRVPTRATKDLQRRAAFAKKLKGLGRVELRKLVRRIVFSDESWLCANEATGRNQYARERSEVLGLERKARWNCPSIMIWGAVGVNYKSDLVILPSKRLKDGQEVAYRLDSSAYIRKCLSTVVPDLVRNGRAFQQDGARSHVAKATLRYLRNKKVELVHDWPPYSPDLSAIERIWKEVSSRVGLLCPLTTDELIAAARKVWAELPQSLINAHCMHLETQLNDL